MKRKKRLYRMTAYLLSMCLLLGNICGCGKVEKTYLPQEASDPVINTEEVAKQISDQIDEELDKLSERKEEDTRLAQIASDSMELFVHEILYDSYSVVYDTFEASIVLPDGNELYGIGYSDFSCFFEGEEGERGYFPAGFLTDPGDYYISESERENVLVVNNLDYEDDRYGFVLTHHAEPYLEHCVVNGQYVKYGVNENGVITYEADAFDWDNFDSELGALYSYDESRNLFTTAYGDEFTLTGVSLHDPIDYSELEASINRILDEQDKNYFTINVITAVSESKEAVTAYLQSLQEETFLGCNVKALIEEVSTLSPDQCIRITPEGNVIVNVGNEVPTSSEELARWLVGIGCGIAVAGSIALNVFVPASAPLSGAICGAAMDVFMQILVEKRTVDNINWAKVAVSATSGAVMAWACPLGASAITQTVAGKTGNVVLSKLAGYGFMTFSNSIVSGATNAAFAAIDGESTEDIFDSFVVGAAVGAFCTVAASLLSEAGQAGMKALSDSHPDNWFLKLTDGTSKFIEGHQVHLKNAKLESILAPKSIYEASQAGLENYNMQNAYKKSVLGGSYGEVKSHSSGKYTQVHEMPSYSSTGTSLPREKAGIPSIKMSVEDHCKTASYGNSREAILYRAKQRAYCEAGDYHAAIQMDLDNLKELKLAEKYAEHIEKMLKYAESIGWW